MLTATKSFVLQAHAAGVAGAESWWGRWDVGSSWSLDTTLTGQSSATLYPDGLLRMDKHGVLSTSNRWANLISGSLFAGVSKLLLFVWPPLLQSSLCCEVHLDSDLVAPLAVESHALPGCSHVDLENIPAGRRCPYGSPWNSLAQDGAEEIIVNGQVRQRRDPYTYRETKLVMMKRAQATENYYPTVPWL